MTESRNTEKKDQCDLENGSKDAINPEHYKKGSVECIDAIEAATIGKKGAEAVYVANVIKYLWRYENKDGIKDVKKAQWYLERLLKHLNK